MQNLTVLKVEGLGNLTTAKFSVYLGSQVEYKGAIKDAVAVSMSNKSDCVKLEITDEPNDLCISSVSFFPNIITVPGLHWLPLFLSDDNFLEELPVQISMPRVLLDIHMDIQAALVELSDSSDTCDVDLESLVQEGRRCFSSKNTELVLKVTELEKSLSLVKMNSEIEIEEIIQKYKEKVHKLNKDLKKTYQVITKKDDLILAIQKEINLIRLGFENTMKERNELLEKVTKLEKIYENLYSFPAAPDKLFKTDSSSPCQSPLKLFTVTSEESLSFMPSPDSSLRRSHEIYNLSSKIVETELKLKKYKHLEEIDRCVGLTLQALNLNGFLKLSDEAVYSLGNKKVNVFLKENTAFVKYGGISKTLEAFLSASCSQEIDSFLRTRQNGKSFTNKSTSRSSCRTEKVQQFMSPNNRLDHEIKPPLGRNNSKLRKLKIFEPMSQNLSSRNLLL